VVTVRPSRWILGVVVPLLASGCDTLLGLDPGKIPPVAGGGSAGAPATAATTSGTGGGACSTSDASTCSDVVWAKVFGDVATQHCAITSLAVDAQGGIVMAGYFGPQLTFGETLYAVGLFDFFLVKLDADGNLLWQNSFGSIANDSATFPVQVAVDPSGSVALAGAVNGAIDFGGGTLQPTPDKNGFVAKFDDQGNYLWANRFGSSPESQVATQVAVDPQGNVVVAGWFQGSLDFGLGPLDGSTDGNQNGFLAQFDASSGATVWSKGFASKQSVDVGAIAVDGTGDVVVAGNLDGYVDLGAATLTGSGVYLARFDDLGGYVWSSAAPATGGSYATGASIDRFGDALVTGTFNGSIQFGTQLAVSNDTGFESYLVKLDPTGAPLWSQALPTTHVAVDGMANVLVAGSFSHAIDFGGTILVAAGGEDMVLAKLDPTGAFLWSKSFGDAQNLYATAVAALPGSNRVLVAGYGAGTVDFGNGPLTGLGSENLYLAVFQP
jgi:hypothetical protein